MMIGTATPSAPMSDQSPTELSAPIVSLFGVEIVAVNDVSVPEVYPAGEGQRAVECNLDGKFLAPGEIEGEGNRLGAAPYLTGPQGRISVEEGDLQLGLIARNRVQLPAKDSGLPGRRQG